MRDLELSLPSDPPAMMVISRGSHPGVDDALRQMEADGSLRAGTHHAVPPQSRGAGIESRWSELARLVKANRVELVVLHHYHGRESPDPRPFLSEIRDRAHRPTVALTCGDAFFNGFFRPSHPKVFRDACSEVDVVLSTSMGIHADVIRSYGAPRVLLWPNGADQTRFRPMGDGTGRDRHRDFDVVFIGSNNRPRNPLASYHWYAKRRERLVRNLAHHYGKRFGVFGHGWGGLASAQGPVDFDRQVDVCRRANIIVGGVPFSPARYYTSNRPFIQILAGVPFVDIRVEGVDQLLRDGEHWHLVNDIDNVPAMCDELLRTSADYRDGLASAAAEFVWEHHTQQRRWRTLVANLNDLRRALLEGLEPGVADWSFLLPEGDRPLERRLASMGFLVDIRE